MHPFLLAVFPVLFLYDHNIAETPTYQIYLPLLLSLGATLVLGLLFWVTTRSVSKSALIVSTGSVIFFNYGRGASALKKVGLDPIADNLPWLTIFIFVLIGFAIMRTDKDLRDMTNLLNIAIGAMVAISLVGIGAKTVNAKSVWDEIGLKVRSDENLINLEAGSTLPDIYYIILDSYPREDTLREIYAFDNTDFIDWLEVRGFYVAGNSRSNYAQTYFSLASSLNMEHIDYLTEIVGTRTKETAVPARMIEDNKLMRFAKSLGYQTIFFRSGWSGTDHNKYADMEINYGGGDEFTMLLVEATALRPFEARLGLVRRHARQRILSIFERLGEIPKENKPTFTFAHLVPPHPPYFFGAQGEKVERPKLAMQGLVWTQKQKYINQLIFVNGKVKTLVDKILKTSNQPPIIVIHSDHGSASTFYTEKKGGWTRPTDRQLRERMRNFNALYAPKISVEKLRPDLSPVNNWRLIFNEYFGADFALLEDKSLYSNYRTPYDFQDMTGRISISKQKTTKTRFP